MSTNTSEAIVESVRPVIVVSSDPRGVDVDNGEEIVCSVGSSILCVTLTKVSFTRLGGYIRRLLYIQYTWRTVRLMNILMNYSNAVRLYVAV